MKPIEEVLSVIEENQNEIKAQIEEMSRERTKHKIYQDSGYIDHCREIISQAKATISTLKWAYEIK